MHKIHRRLFVTATARAATGTMLAAALPRWSSRRLKRPTPLGTVHAPGATTLRDPQVKALALTAVDAAKQAGAAYADVRISYTRQRSFAGSTTTCNYDESEGLGLSVRALVDGYWGWAATSYVAANEAPRVAQAAVGLAKGNAATGQVRHVDWTPVPVVSDGSWTSPIQEDPFQTAIPQLMDWVNGMVVSIIDTALARGGKSDDISFNPFPWMVYLTLRQQERVVASTEGSYCTQTVYVTDPHVGFQYRGASVVLPIRPAQMGYEYITETPWQELIRQGMDRADEMAQHPLPSKLLDIGRYDIVFGAAAMAALVTHTWGPATQVDRALGYEANAGGTSYLGPDPLAFLGTPVAAPLVTVTADRTTPQAVATAQWDEQGVRTEAFPIVQHGTLQDYQTSREQAAWLAPWYTKQGRSVHSHGCAAGPDALAVQLSHTPNLTLQPGREPLGVNELTAGLTDGLVIEDLAVVDMDFQSANGLAFLNEVVQVRRGKRWRVYGQHLALMVHSVELWKRVQALGGPQSVEGLYPGRSTKGEPEQQVAFSVSAVPALVQQLAVVDYTR